MFLKMTFSSLRLVFYFLLTEEVFEAYWLLCFFRLSAEDGWLYSPPSSSLPLLHHFDCQSPGTSNTFPFSRLLHWNLQLNVPAPLHRLPRAFLREVPAHRHGRFFFPLIFCRSNKAEHVRFTMMRECSPKLSAKCKLPPLKFVSHGG